MVKYDVYYFHIVMQEQDPLKHINHTQAIRDWSLESRHLYTLSRCSYVSRPFIPWSPVHRGTSTKKMRFQSM